MKYFQEFEDNSDETETGKNGITFLILWAVLMEKGYEGCGSEI